jgi:hypothetical protein
MHPDQMAFLGSDRVAALRDEARRNQLLTDAPPYTTNRSEPTTVLLHALTQMVARTLRLVRPTRRPFAAGISRPVQRIARTTPDPR